MPAPPAIVLNSAAIMKFRSFQIQLPTAPTGVGGLSVARSSMIASASSGSFQKAGSTTRSGSTTSQQQTRTPMSMPPALFKAASNNLQDVDYQRQMHDKYTNLFQGLTSSIAQAWQQFHSSATLEGVSINGPVATGGRIGCPTLETTVYTQSFLAGTGPWELKIREQVAKAFWTCWKQMLDGVRVPGLPWYPAFAAFPGPLAPPMPNVPTPFATIMGDHWAMGMQNLKTTLSNLLQGKMDYHTQFSEALAMSMDGSFQVWKIQTQVINVFGSGPIPTFAPPYVPVGPVVGGTGKMLPGGFA